MQPQQQSSALRIVALLFFFHLLITAANALCDAGTYSAVAGQTVCVVCGGGTYATGVGASACSAAPPTVTEYLRPASVTGLPSMFYCESSGAAATVCGAGGCTGVCDNAAKITDNNTGTMWNTLTAGVSAAHSVDFYFNTPVVAQRFHANIYQNWSVKVNRAQWTIRAADSIGGAYTNINKFVLPNTNTFVDTFRDMVFFGFAGVAPRRVWSFLTDAVGDRAMLIQEAYFSAVYCPQGFFMLNLSACAPCPPGTYGSAISESASPVAAVCAGCAAGQYSTALGATANASCGSCGGQYATALGASSAKDCITCSNGGAYFRTSALDCVPCGAASYCPVGGGCADACIACPPHTQPSVGATTCVSGGCFVCPAGGYCDGGNTVMPCAAGTFSGVAGQSLPTVCAACGQGLFASAAGATACLACAPGTAATLASAATECVVCAAGTYATGQRSFMACGSNCSRGTYASGLGASTAAACASCVGGTYSAGVGASVCQICPAGVPFVGNASAAGAKTQAEACLAIACPSNNSASAVAGATSIAMCVCNAGFFTAAKCVACSRGSYAIGSNASACVACPINTYDPSTLASTLRDTQYICQAVSPQDCWAPAGATDFYANAGYYRNLLLSQCTQCPKGSFNADASAVACTPCANGFTVATATATALGCRCNAGFVYNATARQQPCSAACPAGLFCVDGVASACPSNSKTFVEGSDSPSFCKCVPGYYAFTLTAVSAVTGGAVVGCQLCDANFVCAGGAANNNNNNASTAAGVMIKCPANTFAPPGTSASCACLPGFTRNDSAAGCIACPANTFCSSGNATACGNNSMAGAGATSSDNCSCIPGFFLSSQQAQGCVACPINSYCTGGVRSTPCGGNASTGGQMQRSSADTCRCNAGFSSLLGACALCAADRLLFQPHHCSVSS